MPYKILFLFKTQVSGHATQISFVSFIEEVEYHRDVEMKTHGERNDLRGLLTDLAKAGRGACNFQMGQWAWLYCPGLGQAGEAGLAASTQTYQFRRIRGLDVPKFYEVVSLDWVRT
jgi:hypothetical protein